MAAIRHFIILLAFVITINGDNDYERDIKKKTLAMEKEHRARSANPARERGSLHKLSSLMNRTEEGRSRRKGKENFNKILLMNRKPKANDFNHMMNDNEGAIAINHKTISDNDTNSLAEKMKVLRVEGPTYEATNKNNYIPQVTGVYCGFENVTHDMCLWEWNTTVSSHGLGFKIMTDADLVLINQSTRGLKFTGPTFDADRNVDGHFLYLPVDPTMENMAIKSPIFRGLWEFCKFEAQLHQSRMQNASIRLISESTAGVQWILQEVAGNNFEVWQPMRFMIGKVQQEVRIIIEVTRPTYVSLSQPLPHIAVDNIRMVDCLPEPPVFDGECQPGQLKCSIMNKESCIKLQQVCDLVKDCDDGSDEHQHCDKMPFGSYCNFEVDTCGFGDVPQPILKWVRHSGPTPTDKTGPNFDHTCGPPPPHPVPTLPPPPLTPAHRNHSLSHCVGFYYFVNMNVTGPNKEKADFASTAIMRTVTFNPPPKVHGNITSKFYNCCMIRFYYQQNGRNYGSLSVHVVELSARGNVSTSLWFSTKDKGENWYRAAIFLPNITRRYFLQFKTRMGMRIYSDSAIDDFSMAPECFGLNIPPEELGDYNYYDPVFEEKTTPHPAFADKTYYRFTSCGASGRYGPNQTQCDAAYNNTPVSVNVVTTPPHQGIQVWTVPEEAIYTIIAIGASGGLGSAWAGVTHGALTRALFHLHKGEHIYILVGQQGTNACKKTLSAQESQECSRRSNESSQVYTSKTHEVRNTHVEDGGGGGGGGTFVFVMDKEGTPTPLLIAGGGGGISVGTFRDDGSQHARGLTNATPEVGYIYGDDERTAGSGGGWTGRGGMSSRAGASVSGGAAGGSACGSAEEEGSAMGGYGGGGGACRRGGAGGGWIGGSINQGEHGGGGYSYIDLKRSLKHLNEASMARHMGPGEVLIVPAIHSCGCDYRCVVLNEYRSSVKCYCPSTWITDAHDPTKCVLSTSWDNLSWVVIAVLSVVVFLSSFFIICVCLYLYNTYQRKKEAEIRRKRLIEQELQLHRLRTAPGGNENALTAFNPHYGSEGFLPQGIDVRGLPQVSRESLKLVKALGQGAFGEVYQGLYRHRSGDSVEMPVAVKTLPELSTGQAESDFLMEAAIMAKFNHPNIVHLIGVCFDRHPRFIVLELLAGGDLKNFLRESRPKPERASALTMKDLLLCALDVCKGCRYLEAKRFIHRDIAARNCLLTSRGPGRVVKIADFGMARDIYRADYYKKGGKAMLPIKWMPPEAYIDGVFTIKTDVWSFGVLVWEVFSLGVMPYTGCANREVMEMVSGGGRLEKPYGCPQEIYRLMCECWNPTPSARPAFAQMFDRLSLFLQDPEIVGAPLPVLRTLIAHTEESAGSNGLQRAPAPPACDYLVPMSPPALLSADRQTEPDMGHSISPTGAQDTPDSQASQYQHHLKVSQDYGNIPATCCAARSVVEAVISSVPTKTTTKFLSSNSTDRLICSVDAISLHSSDDESTPAVWETSFTHAPQVEAAAAPPPAPKVDKLISITPTSPKPPENVLSMAIEANIIDKTNHKTLAPEKLALKPAAEPPRLPLPPKPKPLCLDAAQLEQNLNALKKNSGSVNLNTMVLPPYINVVTPNKFKASKCKIEESEATENKVKLKQSSSSSSLINGPMTDVPYADSDNASSSSGSNPPNHIQNIQKSKANNYSEVKIGNDVRVLNKQGSNGGGDISNESQISC